MVDAEWGVSAGSPKEDGDDTYMTDGRQTQSRLAVDSNGSIWITGQFCKFDQSNYDPCSADFGGFILSKSATSRYTTFTAKIAENGSWDFAVVMRDDQGWGLKSGNIVLDEQDNAYVSGQLCYAAPRRGSGCSYYFTNEDSTTSVTGNLYSGSSPFNGIAFLAKINSDGLWQWANVGGVTNAGSWGIRLCCN